MPRGDGVREVFLNVAEWIRLSPASEVARIVDGQGGYSQLTTDVLFYTVNGIIVGAITALAALGITLVFGVARFPNLGHGDLVTLGAYLALLFNRSFDGAMVGATLFAVIICSLLGVFIYTVVFRRLAGVSPLASAISSLGIALVARHVVILLWGTSPVTFQIPLEPGYHFAGIFITKHDLLIFGIALAVMVALHLLLQFTLIGKRMRAVAHNPVLARAVGISPDVIHRWTWAVALGLAALAGVLLGVKTIVTPYMGWDLLLPAFAAAILGGIGNAKGAMFGGLILGVVGEISTIWLAPSYKTALALVAMILILLFRPMGLFSIRSAIK